MRIGIIGGGAAGMMSAALLYEKDHENRIGEIVLFECNTVLGRKLALTGGGRCNVTTGNFDIAEVLKNYPRGANFLKKSIYDFSPKHVFDWFRSHGVKLKVEEDRRVFPVTDNSSDIIDVFLNIYKNPKTKIKKSPVIDMWKEMDRFAVRLHDEIHLFDKVIMATGGGDNTNSGIINYGYAFAQKFGHKITKLAPGLTSLETNDCDIHTLKGITLSNIKLRFLKKDEHVFNGSCVFTHKGLSGPGIFAISSLSAFENYDESDPALLLLDLLPEENFENLKHNLEQTRLNSPAKKISNLISNFIPKSLAEIMLKKLKINDKKSSEVSAKDLNRIIDSIKNFQVVITGRISGSEFVTAGGVDLNEVDAATMESKLVKGLHFAGEILN